MSTACIEKNQQNRPKKPRSDYPLFPHASRQWAKKVRGRLRYFGKWSNPEAAEHRWLAQRDDLLAGRPVRPVGADELLVKDLCNQYLTYKQGLVQSGELAPRSFAGYMAACRRLARVVGSCTAISHLVREDFSHLRADMSKTWGPQAVLNEIRRVRMIFTWGVAQNLLEHLPQYGDGMKRPSAKVLRMNRSAKGSRMFEAEQIRTLIAKAGPTLRAMILLGINCGFGNTDLGRLEKSRLDLKEEWADYPRPKTGVPRRCPLWPETVAAIRTVLRIRKRAEEAEKESLAQRREGAEEGEQTPPPAPRSTLPLRRHVFLTKAGRTWMPAATGNPISTEFLALAKRCKVWRRGLGFYALRHTFQTIGGEVKDEPAVSAIMGHFAKTSDMAAVYRERINDDRLKAVTEYVRGWLFEDAKK